MENAHLKNISGLLLATLFISTSGVLGRYIAMPTEVIIWFRAAIAMVLLYLYCKYKKIDLTIKSPKDYKPFFISGLLMAVHWVTYFYALKLSNVALGVLSLYTFPIIIALLEPLFLKVKFDPIYILLGLMVLTGLFILTPEFNIEKLLKRRVRELESVVTGLTETTRTSTRRRVPKISNHSSAGGGVLSFGLLRAVRKSTRKQSVGGTW